jgi:N-acetyl-anhydromuramyl-L-alanine amidase AmpD
MSYTIERITSPAQKDRAAGSTVSLVVLHGTVGSDAGDFGWLSQGGAPGAPVSYHYWISRRGRIVNFVPPARQAFHAGISEWKGRKSVNNFSIGVGLSNLGVRTDVYTEAQYTAAGWLCALLHKHHVQGFENYVGHHHVSPGRKTDPWDHFEWGRFFGEMGRHL